MLWFSAAFVTHSSPTSGRRRCPMEQEVQGSLISVVFVCAA
jgi:hypothetical protein